jgi:predicted phage tail protein/sulfur carrier protein ThiS
MSQFKLIFVRNPFDPNDRVMETFDFEDAKPQRLSDHMEDTGDNSFVVSISGKVVPSGEYDQHYITDGDVVVVCPVPEGGGSGGSKAILRLVAMIAIMIVAWEFAPVLAQAFGGAEAVWAMGITMAGGLLVNAMMPNKPMGGEYGQQGMEDSPTYGIDGARNTSLEGIPVPVCYGQFRMAGNILNLHTENFGKYQDLYMLFNAGEGPVSALGSIEVNGQPVSNFQNVEVDLRNGYSSQTPMGWFNDTISPFTQSQLVTTDWKYYSTSGQIDRVRFDLVFPSGLYLAEAATGRKQQWSVGFAIEYKRTGTGDPWTPLPIGSVIVGFTNPLMYLTLFDEFNRPIGESEVSSLPSGYWLEGTEAVPPYTGAMLSGPIWGQYLNNEGDTPRWDYKVMGRWTRNAIYSDAAGIYFTDAFTQALRYQVWSPSLAQDDYDFRYRRTTVDETFDANPAWLIQDDLFLSDINEVINDDIGYNNTALVGLKIRVTDQISGVPSVTYINYGKMIRVWETTGYWSYYSSSNPAYVALDMLTDTRYGAGIPDSRIDMEMWKQWGIFCSNNGLTFNGVFDTAMNIWDALSYVFRVGHASMLMKGTRYSVAIEGPTEASMMFSVANIVEGSFKQSWTSLTDRINEVDVSFFDKEDGYKQRTVKVVDQVAQNASGIQRNTGITTFGIVDANRAYNEGLLALNMNRYIKQHVTFAAPTEAIGCTIGDVIYVQHDMPQWGYAGRVEQAINQSTIRLDREVPYSPPTTYKFLLIHDKIARTSGTLTSMPSGKLVYVSNVTPSMKAKRLVIGSLKDVRVIKPLWGAVEIEDQGGVVPGWIGQTAVLYDTDVIEERDVVSVVGNDVTVSSPFSAVPNTFGQWMYGETSKVKKPFRVRGISGSDFNERTISAIEYNASVYDMSGAVYPVPNYSSLDPNILHVTILGADEELIKLGAAITTRVTVMWEPQQDSYVMAECYVSINGGPFFSLGRYFDRASVNADDASLLVFKVVAINNLGKVAPSTSAPTHIHTVIGKTAKPKDVTGLTIAELLSGTQLSWNAVTDLDLRGYEIRLGGASWEDATVLVQNLASTSYLDKKRVSSGYRYRVKAVDVLGNYSENDATVLYTVDPPPQVMGFSVALVQRSIVMNWNAIINPNIVGYEIRLGSTWDSATPIVTNLNSTTFTEARRVPGDYKYWIAGITNLGEYSGTKSSYTLTVPRIAAPTGVHAEPRVGDILVTWNPVNDIDLTGYEVRVGADWDNSELLITGFSGTSFVDGKRGAGTYHYMVRSYGTQGNESLTVGSYTLTLVPPVAVTGFDCVQNGDRIEFRWEPNPELDLIGYEIREGSSWGVGIKVVELLGTSYTMPASSIAGDRTFWIKAIVEPGIEGDIAMFSTTDIAEPTDRNVLIVQDEHGTGFTGTKFNMTVQSGDLQLNAGQSYGEYTFAIDLPQVYRARNSLAVAFDAIIPDTETWNTATYTWTSPQAGRTWTIAGDRGQIGLEFYISRFIGLDPAYLDGWSLNNSTTSENGTVAATATGVTYAPGRYLNGARIAPATTLNWNKTVAQYFHCTFWATIDDTNPPSRQVFWKGVKSGGVQWLEVSYNPTTAKFELRDNALNTIQVTPPGTYAIGDKIMFAVVQTASARSLYVGMLNKGTAQASAAHAAIGALAIIQLHP